MLEVPVKNLSGSLQRFLGPLKNLCGSACGGRMVVGVSEIKKFKSRVTSKNLCAVLKRVGG